MPKTSKSIQKELLQDNNPITKQQKYPNLGHSTSKSNKFLSDSGLPNGSFGDPLRGQPTALWSPLPWRLHPTLSTPQSLPRRSTKLRYSVPPSPGSRRLHRLRPNGSNQRPNRPYPRRGPRRSQCRQLSTSLHCQALWRRRGVCPRTRLLHLQVREFLSRCHDISTYSTYQYSTFTLGFNVLFWYL